MTPRDVASNICQTLRSGGGGGGARVNSGNIGGVRYVSAMAGHGARPVGPAITVLGRNTWLEFAVPVSTFGGLSCRTSGGGFEWDGGDGVGNDSPAGQQHYGGGRHSAGNSNHNMLAASSWQGLTRRSVLAVL
jgi:hypothetical protein